MTAVRDAWSSVADTAETPPFSAIDEADSDSVAVSVASSSAMVRVTARGAFTSPFTAPETVTDLSGVWVVSSTAVTVTAPVLAVAPVAKVSVVVLDRLKSPAVAPLPGAAATVIVAAESAALSSVAVTVAAPPFSAIHEDDSASVALGSATMGTHSA